MIFIAQMHINKSLFPPPTQKRMAKKEKDCLFWNEILILQWKQLFSNANDYFPTTMIIPNQNDDFQIKWVTFQWKWILSIEKDNFKMKTVFFKSNELPSNEKYYLTGKGLLTNAKLYFQMRRNISNKKHFS